MSLPSVCFWFAILGGILDVGANLSSVKSAGFSKRGWGLLSIGLVLVAFACLAEAIKGIDLAIAYAVLGATGILGTAISGRLFLGHKLKPVAWLGFLFVIGSVVLLHSSETQTPSPKGQQALAPSLATNNGMGRVSKTEPHLQFMQAYPNK